MNLYNTVNQNGAETPLSKYFNYFFFKGKKIKVKAITFEILEDFLQAVKSYEMLLKNNGKSVLDIKKFVVKSAFSNIKINTEKQALKILNNICDLVCDPVIKVSKKDMVQISNNIANITQWKLIDEKINKAKNEYERKTRVIKSKKLNRQDFYTYQLSAYYRQLISVAGYISYSDFKQIAFLEVDEVLDCLIEHKLIKYKELGALLISCHAFGNGKEFEKLMKKTDTQLDSIRKKYFDDKAFAEKLRELRNEKI